MHVRTGDNVEVLAGRDRGRRGKVLRVLRAKDASRTGRRARGAGGTDRVVIEKLNLIKKHQKPTQRNPVGGIVEKEAPIHVSNVQLVCPRCDRPRRFSRAESDAGRKVRVCRKCGERVEAAA